MSSYEEHLGRTLAAVALQPVDRVPFSYLGTAVNAQFTGTSLASYCSDMELNCTTNLKGIELVGEVDSTQATIFQPRVLATCWLSKVLIPGEDLPDNELWQIHEKELVTQADYDEILEGGFAPWYGKLLATKLGDPLPNSSSFFEYMGVSIGRFAQAGIPSINGGNFYTPFEMFCGGRSLPAFFTDDLIDIPDKLDAVFALAQEFNMNNFAAQLNNPAGKPLAVWIGGWRGTPGMLSVEMFERFSWKYMAEIADLVLSNGVIPIFHLDSDWGRGLEYFKKLPKGKSIIALDGTTDIFQAKQILGDHSCIMGDVPSRMTAMATPDEVTAYCKQLISDVGSTGFILCSGCDIPYNAKLENVQAIAASVRM